MFINPAIKHYKELWRVEDRARWGLKLLSKQYGMGFAEIHSGNRKSRPKS
jgi:hypothetical protein